MIDKAYSCFKTFECISVSISKGDSNTSVSKEQKCSLEHMSEIFSSALAPVFQTWPNRSVGTRKRANRT